MNLLVDLFIIKEYNANVLSFNSNHWSLYRRILNDELLTFYILFYAYNMKWKRMLEKDIGVVKING